MFMAGGRREDAELLWRALAPHVQRFPDRAPEWVIAAVGNAEVCSWLGDVETARVVYDQLAPYAGLHAIGLAARPTTAPSTWRSDGSPRRTATPTWPAPTCRPRSAPSRRCTPRRTRRWCSPSSVRRRAPLGPRALATPLGMEPLLARLAVRRRQSAEPPRVRDRRAGRRRAEQRRHRLEADAVGTDGREPRQPRAPQARPDLPRRHRVLALAQVPLVEEGRQNPGGSQSPVS